MRCHKIYICEECKKQFDKYNDFQKHKKEHDTKGIFLFSILKILIIFSACCNIYSNPNLTLQF